MKVSDAIMEQIKVRLEKVDYGSVEIVVNKENNHIDLLTHNKERIKIDSPVIGTGEKNFRAEQA